MKGVSDKDAQNNKKIKGDKNNVKKPLQVLHISKKDTQSKKEEVVDDNQSPSKEIKTDIKALKHISTSVDKSISEVRTGMYGNRRVFPTKWPRLNKNLMGGLQRGKMYVVAGRPGVGKSAFSNQMIFDILDSNEEKVVNTMTNGLTNVLVDNPWLVDYIKKHI